MAGSASRVPVAKTHKIYINGKFPRTESGRYFTLDNEEEIIQGAIVCQRPEDRIHRNYRRN